MIMKKKTVVEANRFSQIDAPNIWIPLKYEIQGMMTSSAIFRPVDSRVLSEAVAS